MFIKCVLVLAVSLQLSNAASQVPPYPKDCPTIYPVQLDQIDKSDIPGRWYEVVSTENVGYTCGVIKTTETGDMKYQDQGSYLMDGVQKNLTVQWEILEAESPAGAVLHTYEGYVFQYYSYILYSKSQMHITYACMDGEGGKQEIFQVFSSKPFEYDEDVVKSVMDKNGLGNLVTIDNFADCPETTTN